MDPDELRERALRLQTVAEQMDALTRDIGPKLIKLAHLREEARTIMEQMGVKPDGQPTD